MCDNSSRLNPDDDALWYELLQREKTQRDWESKIIVARDKGRQEGIEEGMAKRDIEIARNLLNMNISLKDIQKTTGLALSVIESLK